MECFRAPAADGGCAPAGGGGVRAVAGRPTVKAAAAQSKGPERVAPAAVQPPAGRSSVKRPPARVALTAPSSARLSLSATKSKSVSRLPGSGAPAGRDENRPRGESCDRPAWGRASAPSLPGSAPDRATGRQGLVSSVGKFGLGRNRAGGMAKSRSTSVLKPFNS